MVVVERGKERDRWSVWLRITLARVIASRLSIEVGKTYLRNVHGIIYSTRLCVPAQRDRGQKRNGARVFQGRATASARFSSASRGVRGGEGLASWFFRNTSTNEYIRVIFFYSLPTSDIYIYGYIYIAARSVCFMAYTGKGESELAVRGGENHRSRTVGLDKEFWTSVLELFWRLFGNRYTRYYLFSLENNWFNLEILDFGLVWK